MAVVMTDFNICYSIFREPQPEIGRVRPLPRWGRAVCLASAALL